jgi:hypothetical protein
MMYRMLGFLVSMVAVFGRGEKRRKVTRREGGGGMKRWERGKKRRPYAG